jgi:hypothetical protein
MKFDSITLLEQIIHESIFNKLNVNVLSEQSSRISINLGTDNWQERNLTNYPGSVASFIVKSKGMNEQQIISAIKSDTNFGDSSKYANGNYAYTLGRPVREREATNMKKYVVLIYPLNNKYFKWFYGTNEQQKRDLQIQELKAKLNPSHVIIQTSIPKNKIGDSIIYTYDDFNKLKEYNNSQSKELENLKSNQEITIQQSQQIDQLQQQLLRQTYEIEQLKNQQQAVTEPEAEQRATVEGAQAAAPPEIKEFIWLDNDSQIKLAVGETDAYLITLENGVYMIDTPAGKIKLSDY